MSNEKTISNNHEILFVYDAKMCNPNGDPDNENKPRMDVDREMSLPTLKGGVSYPVLKL